MTRESLSSRSGGARRHRLWRVAETRWRKRLRHPLQQPDNSHGGGAGVGRHLACARFDLLAAFRVIQIRLDHHLLVRQGGMPAQTLADPCRIEDKIFGDHLVVIWTPRRKAAPD